MVAGERRLLVIAVLMAFALSGLAPGQAQDQSSPPPPPQTQAQPGVPERVRVSAEVTAGLLLERVNPKYPKKARKKHIQGVVVLSAKITKDGDIADLSVISGDPLLARAATDAVKQWKYRPYLRRGKPVDVETHIEVNFTLSGN